MLNHAVAQHTATKAPHMLNQVVIPIASAIKPENESPIGAASEEHARKIPMMDPNFSSGVRC